MFATSDTFFDSFVKNNSFSISEKTLTPELIVEGDGIEFEIEQMHSEFRDSDHVAKKRTAAL
jgi:acid stress-induced BolA-like protein IbaG/YrbA